MRVLTLNSSDGGHTPEETPETGHTGVVNARPHCPLVSSVVRPGVEVPAAGAGHHDGDGLVVPLEVAQVSLGLGQIQLVPSEVSLAVERQVPCTGTFPGGWQVTGAWQTWSWSCGCDGRLWCWCPGFWSWSWS